MTEESKVPAVGRRAESSDTLAPDGSEIRLLLGEPEAATKASLCEVTLGAREVSRPVWHRSVEELWYVIKGVGRVWRCPPDKDAANSNASGGRPGRRAGNPDGVEFSVRSRRVRADLPVLHITSVARRGRGAVRFPWRLGQPNGLANSYG